MRRRFTDPEEQKIANRWMAISLTFYVALMLATVAVGHLTAPAGTGQVAQVGAKAASLQRTVAR